MDQSARGSLSCAAGQFFCWQVGSVLVIVEEMNDQKESGLLWDQKYRKPIVHKPGDKWSELLDLTDQPELPGPDYRKWRCRRRRI